MTKRTGILSMQRVPNYGSFMQAWALRGILRESGVEVSFIEIEPGRQLAGYGHGGKWAYLNELAGAAMRGKLGAKLRRRAYHHAISARYRDEWHDMLGLNAPPEERLDLAIIGSDQVFNCLEPSPWGFTTQLFGNVPHAARVASYGASFGSTTVDDLHRAGVADEVAAGLAALHDISVRDDNSWNVVKALAGRDAHRHLDPALVYDFSHDIEGQEVSERDYIVIYAYGERITDPAEVNAIRTFARANGKRLISLFYPYDWCERTVIPCTPLDILTWFRGADFVITDTFHGTIFSIITHRNFATLTRATTNNRIVSLLGWLGLEGRATTAHTLPEVLADAPDYVETDSIIAVEKVRTREYLASLMV